MRIYLSCFSEMKGKFIWDKISFNLKLLWAWEDNNLGAQCVLYTYIFNIRWTLMGNRWNLCLKPPFKISFDIWMSRSRDKSMDRKCRPGPNYWRTCIPGIHLYRYNRCVYTATPNQSEGAAGRFWPGSRELTFEMRSRISLWPDIKCLLKIDSITSFSLSLSFSQ